MVVKIPMSGVWAGKSVQVSDEHIDKRPIARRPRLAKKQYSNGFSHDAEHRSQQTGEICARGGPLLPFTDLY